MFIMLIIINEAVKLVTAARPNLGFFSRTPAPPYPPLGPRTDNPSGLARAGALRARIGTPRLAGPRPPRTWPARLIPAHSCAHRHSMYSHSRILDLAVPQPSLRRAVSRKAVCGQPLVACRTYFVSAWCSPTGPRIRFPGEMGSGPCE